MTSNPRALRLDCVYPGPESRTARAAIWSQQLSVIAKFADGTTRDVTALATYEVSHKEVLSVCRTLGLVTGKKRGPGRGERPLPESPRIGPLHGDRGGRRLRLEQPDGNQLYRQALVAREAEANCRVFPPSDTCDDATFLRRVYLDLTGLLPPTEKARAAPRRSDTATDKRAEADRRVAHERGIRPLTGRLRTADLMRVNSANSGCRRGGPNYSRTGSSVELPHEQALRQDGSR